VWERPKSASWPLWVLEAEEGEDKGYNYCANQSQEEEPIFHHATNNGCLQSWSSAAAGEKESGITIHYVNEVYDAGAIILQSHCPILPGYTPNDLAHQIHKLEHFYLPRTIQFLLEAH